MSTEDKKTDNELTECYRCGRKVVKATYDVFGCSRCQRDEYEEMKNQSSGQSGLHEKYPLD